MIPTNQDRSCRQAEPLRTAELSDPRFECDAVRFVTLYSPALGGRGDVSVFVPPELDTPASVPIVLLLHGVYASHWAWFFKGGAHRTARDLIATGRMRPMLLAAPSDGLFQDGSGYLRHSGRDFEAWIVVDVLNEILRTFPCVDRNSPVFIAGLSMGAYGALRLGAKHPGLFRGISALSAVTTIEEMLTFLFDPFPAEQIPAAEMNILHWLEINRTLLPPLRLECGLEDRLLEGNRRLHRELERQRIPHQYCESAGAHTWDYWRTRFGSSLLFFEQVLRGSGAG